MSCSDSAIGVQGLRVEIDLNALPPSFDDSPVVYFLQNPAGEIKIGYSNNVRRRMGELQVGSSGPLRLLLALPGTMEDEANLHVRFAMDRLQGEWFQPSDDLLGWIEAATETRSL